MKETDLRVIKTKKALSSSLLQLLEQQLFQTITVNQICDNALVHRTTFYKHFYDKYDLLEYLFNQLTKDYFARDISDRLNHPFQTMSDTINNKEDLREIAEFQEEDAEFNKVLKNVCIKIMHNDIKNNRDRIDIDSDIPDNLIFYIYDSLIEGFIHWIKDEKLTGLAKILITFSIRSLILRLNSKLEAHKRYQHS